ncbi:glycosyltransferase [Rhodovulum sulfidophilum]|uniref:glycosyltransferase n=1 Tax=Rhodovulum sulfidophilum TaxID=35806 RepID=UPI001924891A|nr:glycosyltransferase [Rhodovulum sulfidophilum]MBL3561465.1 glycosyltransferase [Rhodovulum sulfidophilum]
MTNPVSADPRVAAAVEAICVATEAETGLTVLGQGDEGVVVSDGTRIWKLFDRWTAQKAEAAVPVLARLISQGDAGAALKAPLSLRRAPAGWLLELPHEVSEPWPGGHGPGLVELLADLHRAGLAFRNLHPKNLRVTGETVRLIDFGADLVFVDDPQAQGLDFHQMCRRAWLCWRWFWRTDLSDLMRRSLSADDLPELSGHEALVKAVRLRLGLCQQDDPLAARASALQPESVLVLAEHDGAEAAELPCTTARVIRQELDPAADLSEATLATAPFDLTIWRSGRIPTDVAAFDRVLAKLRHVTAPQGRILLEFPHPAYGDRLRFAGPERLIGCEDRRGTMRSLSERALRRRLGRAGLRLLGRHERCSIEVTRFEPASDLLVLELEIVPVSQVSLLIKACAMDAEAVLAHVHDFHDALSQGTTPYETVLALDPRQSGFVRAHTDGDLTALRAMANQLLAAGEIDRIVETPEDPSELCALNTRWFGLDLAATHSSGGAACAALLAGFEACAAPRVLHADLDMMIGPAGPGQAEQDTLADMEAALDADPAAVSASFPIARAVPAPWTAVDRGRPWRVESRLGLVDMARMRRLLPLPNKEDAGAPQLSWHRALDRVVASGKAHSLRGGGGACGIHPPNNRKGDLADWEKRRLAIARRKIPAGQHLHVEWTGTPEDWCLPERNERFILVLCGRNVMPERFRRCWESVLRQRRADWGAIVIDDASEPWNGDEMAQILAPHRDRVSFLRRRRRGGSLTGLVHAVREICSHGDQMIVTLDSDDHLIGDRVLDRLDQACREGADLTVGSMLRTDKAAFYPVQFHDLQAARGGNVWQHLRSFRKALFDAVPDEFLKLDGEYVDLATDWAFMPPIAMLARNPVWIRDLLYLHEPGVARTVERTSTRELIIGRLMERLPSIRGCNPDGSQAWRRR